MFHKFQLYWYYFNEYPRNNESLSILLTTLSKLICSGFIFSKRFVFPFSTRIHISYFIQMYLVLRDTSSIQLSTPPSGSRFAWTSETIKKGKHKPNQKKMVSVRRSAKDYSISKSSVHRYWKTIWNSMPTRWELNQNKRKKFVNWIGHNFRREDTNTHLIFQWKLWAPSRDEADKKDGIKVKQKYPHKVMVWLGVCSQGVTPLVILTQKQ